LRVIRQPSLAVQNFAFALNISPIMDSHKFVKK
jgi:hypothetical protein